MARYMRLNPLRTLQSRFSSRFAFQLGIQAVILASLINLIISVFFLWPLAFRNYQDITFLVNITAPKPYYSVELPKEQENGRVAVKNSKSTIHLAVVACEERGRNEALVMLKSALVFSQDAHLHAHVFTDNSTMNRLLDDILGLKKMADTLGWAFTFSLYPEYFPNTGGLMWRTMWAPCSTQRLFFPSLLSHVDSLIYLDADTIVVSSLKEFWNLAQDEVSGEVLAGMASNTESSAQGHYTLRSKVPYYGDRGVNAGVMVMNLKGMRDFGIEARSIATQVLYNEKIILADQDIYNVIFHLFPQKMYRLDCTYNFNWVYCGEGPKKHCEYESSPGPVCFCHSSIYEGVRIVHGNMKTFNPKWPFLYQIQQAFLKMDLLKDDPLRIIRGLMRQFDNLEETPACFSLTSDALYGNAVKYLENLRTNL